MLKQLFNRAWILTLLLVVACSAPAPTVVKTKVHTTVTQDRNAGGRFTSTAKETNVVTEELSDGTTRVTTNVVFRGVADKQ